MQWVASCDDVSCPQSAVALRQKKSVLGFLRLAPRQFWVPVTGFFHSVHSPPCLTKDGPTQSPSMALGLSVPNPARYLAHQHPCSHLQSTLEQHHLSNKFHFPTSPARRTAKIKPVMAIPSATSVPSTPCSTGHIFPCFCRVVAMASELLSQRGAGCCCPRHNDSSTARQGLQPAQRWLRVPSGPVIAACLMAGWSYSGDKRGSDC